MEATMFSVKLSFQTLTFRDDVRFPSGHYVMLITNNEGVVTKHLYGPLTDKELEQFHRNYALAAQHLLNVMPHSAPHWNEPRKLTDPPT